MMTLTDQTNLIDKLIAENPDVRIIDYLRLIGDVRRIERPMCPRQEVLNDLKIVEEVKELVVRKTRVQKKYLKTYRINI